MIKKIVLTGPESSGKTTLAKELAEALNTVWVPEYAREYLEQLDRPYEQKDLLDIAYGQVHIENQLVGQANEYLICDTDLLTIKIWSEYKYGQCDERILNLIKDREYDLYLLCVPDFPWKYDQLRENENDQEELLELYKKELDTFQKVYIEIEGGQKERVRSAIAYIQSL